MIKLTARLIFLFGMLLGFARSSDAQQVCYSYDGLGRLTGVIDQNNQAAFYDYDAVSNILSIRRQSTSGPVTSFPVEKGSGFDFSSFSEVVGFWVGGKSERPNQE